MARHADRVFSPFLLIVAVCATSVSHFSHFKTNNNVDGPTETTIWSTSYTVSSSWVKAQQEIHGAKGTIAVPIGRPISETTLFVVSEDQPYKQMPEYEEGELWIGGIGVAAGYIHAPELTVQRFMKNPFGEGFVYRTGDIVKKIKETGDYVFVRRMDDQVKIGGFRIELQEIESVYAQHDLVQQAVALVRDNKLVLYLKLSSRVSNNDTKKTLQDIKEFASRSLTYYMVPKAVVVVSVFPQTANGKLDRKALPDPTVDEELRKMKQYYAQFY